MNNPSLPISIVALEDRSDRRALGGYLGGVGKEGVYRGLTGYGLFGLDFWQAAKV
jgi:hypothetical protein